MINTQHTVSAAASTINQAPSGAKTRAKATKPSTEKSKAQSKDVPQTKVKPIKPAKEIGGLSGEPKAWQALNWNEKGGQYAEHFPFVVSKPGVIDPERVGPDNQPVQTIVCLAGPSKRLLRFASERAARLRANEQNYTNLELF